jgi:DNA polymerase III subunit gamma/tau
LSFQATARRWRPGRFEDMIGQEHVAQTLRNALVRGQLAHAFLFTGTRGVGKTTSARILARMLNCSDPDPMIRPCGKCETCIEIARGSSMDVLEIDAASHTGVDDVRELREQLRYAASHGSYRVVILDEVHMLSKAAFNALLKTLEEPPPHVVFILATTEVHKVPQTILSRVQRYDFRRLSPTQVAGRLKAICDAEAIGYELEALEIIAIRADGSMRDGLSLFDQVWAYCGSPLTAEGARFILGVPDHSSHERLLHALVAGSTPAAVIEIHAALERGIEPLEYLRGFGEFLRNVLFSRLDGLPEASLALMPEKREALKVSTASISEGDLLRWSRLISDAALQIRDAHNPRLLLELLVARMAALDKMSDLRALLQGGSPAAAPRTGIPAITAVPPAVASRPAVAQAAAPTASAVNLEGAPPSFARAVEEDATLMALARGFDAVPQSE